MWPRRGAKRRHQGGYGGEKGVKNLFAEGVPNASQFKYETGNGAFPFHCFITSAQFDSGIGPVDFNGFVFGVDQPAQSSAIGQIFPHFLLQGLQPVGIGTKLNDKIGTKMPEALPARRGVLLDAAFQNPASIGGAAGPVGQNETGGRIACDTPAILPRPRLKLGADGAVSSGSQRVSGSNDDDFTLGGHFKGEIGMLAAESGELLIRHRLRGQRRGQERFDGERHTVILTLLIRFKLRTWVGLDARDRGCGEGLAPERRHHGGYHAEPNMRLLGLIVYNPCRSAFDPCLDGTWLMQVGDDLRWAEPGFDDSGWAQVEMPGKVNEHSWCAGTGCGCVCQKPEGVTRLD